MGPGFSIALVALLVELIPDARSLNLSCEDESSLGRMKASLIADVPARLRRP